MRHRPEVVTIYDNIYDEKGEVTQIAFILNSIMFPGIFKRIVNKYRKGSLTKREIPLFDLGTQSPLNVIDIDNAGGSMRSILISDHYVAACFCSLSGKGLKLIVEGGRKDAIDYFNEKYGIARDHSFNCFISYDPNIYINDNHLIF